MYSRSRTSKRYGSICDRVIFKRYREVNRKEGERYILVRNCENMIKRLEKHFEEFTYIKQLVSKDKDLFLAIRENYMNIYYMGGNLAKIGIDRHKNIYFELHKKYVYGEGTGYVRLSLNEHRDKIESIKKNIEKIALSKNGLIDENDGVHKKTTREKICQQWIINKNNIGDGDWYYIDMEYTMKNIPSGRFDMIAIKKTVDENEKHQVALIELKIGSDRYTSMTSRRYNDESHHFKYEDIKNNSLYSYQTKESYVSFGSGLLGHLCDYMRFLNAKHYEILRQEIVHEIKSLIQLGIISEDCAIGRIGDTKLLSDKPEIYFVSYTRVPSLKDDREESIEVMKKTFYKYMYSSKERYKNQIEKGLVCSKYSVQDMLNKDEIKGLLDMEQDFFSIMNPSFTLEIGEELFRFNCIFMDSKIEKAWECLYE